MIDDFCRTPRFLALDDPLIITSGIKWLTRLLKRFPPLRYSVLARILFRLAQNQASKRGAMSRQLAAKHDLWFDRAIHFDNR